MTIQFSPSICPLPSYLPSSALQVVPLTFTGSARSAWASLPHTVLRLHVASLIFRFDRTSQLLLGFQTRQGIRPKESPVRSSLSSGCKPRSASSKAYCWLSLRFCHCHRADTPVAQSTIRIEKPRPLFHNECDRAPRSCSVHLRKQHQDLSILQSKVCSSGLESISARLTILVPIAPNRGVKRSYDVLTT